MVTKIAKFKQEICV